MEDYFEEGVVYGGIFRANPIQSAETAGTYYDAVFDINSVGIYQPRMFWNQVGYAFNTDPQYDRGYQGHVATEYNIEYLKFHEIYPPPTCTNECPSNGATQCSGNGFQTCGNFDADNCLEWSGVTQCNAGFSCQSGQCVQNPPLPTCNDGIQNQGETGIDCGGPCSACAPPQFPISYNIPANCSVAAIQQLWQSVFDVDFSGVQNNLHTAPDQTLCANFWAYKKSGNENFYILSAYPTSPPRITTHHLFVNPSFVQPFTNAVLNSSAVGQNLETVLYNYVTPSLNTVLQNRIPALTDLQGAINTHNDIFRIQSPDGPDWINFPNSINSVWGQIYYYNRSSLPNHPNVSFVSADISISKQFEKLLIINNVTIPVQVCTPNWQQIPAACRPDDTRVIWHNDTNRCGLAPPANTTEDCDYNNNGIIGNISELTDANFEANIYIDDRLLNLSRTYSSEETVEIRDDNGETIIEFEYDFSPPLNLRQITIKKQTSLTNYGYLIVKGIDAEKTVAIDKLTNSTRVCVEDKENIELISDVSPTCSNSGEYLVNCPGTNRGFTCSIAGNLFIVSGLENSAVKEFIGNANQSSCVPDWDCTSFGACFNSQQTRTCADANNCGTLVGRPPLSQSCVSLPPVGCVPNWDCTDYSPQECPSSRQKTRVCTDLNSCGTFSGKPSETQTCVYENQRTSAIKLTTILAIAFGAFGLLFLVAAIIFYIKRKRRRQEAQRRAQMQSRPPSIY